MKGKIVGQTAGLAWLGSVLFGVDLRLLIKISTERRRHMESKKFQFLARPIPPWHSLTFDAEAAGSNSNSERQAALN